MHAIIGRQTAYRYGRNRPVAKITGQSGIFPLAVVEKAAITVDRRIRALVEDGLDTAHIQLVCQGSTRRALNAMVRPQHLLQPLKINYIKRLASPVDRGKALMPCGMPVLSG